MTTSRSSDSSAEPTLLSQMEQSLSDGSSQPTEWPNSLVDSDTAVAMVNDPANEERVMRAIENMPISDDELTNGPTPAVCQQIVSTWCQRVLQPSSATADEPSGSPTRPSTSKSKT